MENDTFIAIFFFSLIFLAAKKQMSSWQLCKSWKEKSTYKRLARFGRFWLLMRTTTLISILDKRSVTHNNSLIQDSDLSKKELRSSCWAVLKRFCCLGHLNRESISNDTGSANQKFKKVIWGNDVVCLNWQSVESRIRSKAVVAKQFSNGTLINLLKIPYLGQIDSTKPELPKWHKYSILNRVIRVGSVLWWENHNIVCLKINVNKS